MNLLILWSSGFLWQKNHFEVAKCLKRNPDILLTRSNKGAGVMILNWTDYITKMATILDDTIKFLKLGDLSVDDTHKLEIKFFELFKKKLIARKDYELIRSIGLQRLRMNGLPKIHKSDILLRPILSMCHSVQHSLVKWLIQLLNPVLAFYSGFFVDDSFIFFFHNPSTPSSNWLSIHGVLWYCFTVY